MFSSMQGKPVLSAGRAAKDSAPVVRLRHFHKGIAVSTMERMAYGLGFDVFRMFPVQPFAMSRAKLRPPVRRLRDPYESSAFQAAEGTQGFFFPRRTAVVVDAVPVRITAAVGAAVFLRDSACFKFFAANRAFSLSFHR